MMPPEDHEDELTHTGCEPFGIEEVARQIEEADMGLSDMEELPEVE